MAFSETLREERSENNVVTIVVYACSDATATYSMILGGLVITLDSRETKRLGKSFSIGHCLARSIEVESGQLGSGRACFKAHSGIAWAFLGFRIWGFYVPILLFYRLGLARFTLKRFLAALVA